MDSALSFAPFSLWEKGRGRGRYRLTSPLPNPLPGGEGDKPSPQPSPRGRGRQALSPTLSQGERETSPLPNPLPGGEGDKPSPQPSPRGRGRQALSPTLSQGERETYLPFTIHYLPFPIYHLLAFMEIELAVSFFLLLALTFLATVDMAFGQLSDIGLRRLAGEAEEHPTARYAPLL